MLSLHDHATMQAAAASNLSPSLHTLLTERIGNLITPYGDLTELTHILVIQPGDQEQDIIEEIGMSPLVNPIDGAHFGDPAFCPWWDWLQRRHGWFEIIAAVGNSGFAYILLIEDAEGVEPDLLELCRTYAPEGTAA